MDKTFIEAVNIDETMKGKELKKAKAVAREFKKNDDENGIMPEQRYAQVDDEIRAILAREKAIQDYDSFLKLPQNLKERLVFLKKIKKTKDWYLHMSYPQSRIGMLTENPYVVSVPSGSKGITTGSDIKWVIL